MRGARLKCHRDKVTLLYFTLLYVYFPVTTDSEFNTFERVGRVTHSGGLQN